MVTTLGSGVSGGSVYVLNLSEPLSFSENSPGLNRRINKVSSCDCTIWTADTGCHGTKAAIGQFSNSLVFPIDVVNLICLLFYAFAACLKIMIILQVSVKQNWEIVPDSEQSKHMNARSMGDIMQVHNPLRMANFAQLIKYLHNRNSCC